MRSILAIRYSDLPSTPGCTVGAPRGPSGSPLPAAGVIVDEAWLVLLRAGVSLVVGSKL